MQVDPEQIQAHDVPGHRPTEPTATHTLDRIPTTTLLTRHEGGFAAQGPGFFVWDRDPAEVIRVAEALQSGRLIGSRSARFMVIEPAEHTA